MSHTPPAATFTFTIPSIHDDIDLDCRIYNPSPSTLFPSETEILWSPRGAVVAHPYAPLGGCYDDWIVLAAVEECLKNGLVVGTFNFRGAPGSKTSTSWTSKAELDDYISFAGFLIHYLQILTHPSSPLHTPSRPPPDTYLTPVPSNITLPANSSVPPSPLFSPQQPINLLLAGYSYGSLITTHLLPTPLIQQRFNSPHHPGDAPSEILARAQSLATQTLKDAQKHHDARRGRSQIAVGGEEGLPGSRRLSRDHSRKSIDAVRRSVDHTRRSIERSGRRLLRGKGSGGGGGGGGAFEAGLQGEEKAEDGSHRNTPSLEQSPRPIPTRIETGTMNTDIEIKTSYLLISPLLGAVAGLATLSLSTFLTSTFHLPTKHDTTTTVAANLVQNPTFVIYGADDFFTSAKKLRRWCAAAMGQATTIAKTTNHGHEAAAVNFRSQEVQGAGHFWREDGVERVLRESVAGWVEEVVVRGLRRGGGGGDGKMGGGEGGGGGGGGG